MDILAQYEKENPEQKQASQEMYGNQSQDVGPIVSFVMRISQGKIENEKQANVVLLIIAGIIAVVAIIIFISTRVESGGVPLPYEQTYKPLQSDL